MKRTWIIIMSLTTLSLSAEQITKVAVLDYARILTAFYADSGEARRIDEMKQVFAAEVKRLQQEIQALEEEKLNADANGDSKEVLTLESRIQDRKNYYQEYVRVKGNQIQQAAANLESSSSLAKEILRKIQYVAESNGYSLVLKRSDPNILWWSYETDITELVLQRLMNN
ncbi:MAG: hypothetical protein B0D92_03775 [Spirochaeta sp. LUC14_002_19_P3]|nr:MAG: hypothetical protein B0D92_03775 [Spirochaeta sp. LUC14_002_19_P3]